MATTRVSNLYPPIVPDTMPAFVRTNTCRIYFSLSSYNSKRDIQHVQISLINQKTNASAFNTNIYPSGIKIAQMKKADSTNTEYIDYDYYIEINPSEDLQEGVFNLNQFYKVQLRFSSKSLPEGITGGKGLAKWLYDNRDYFSEWSKVCLIKGIAQPKIFIYGFEDENKDAESEELVFSSSTIDIIGRLTYEGQNNEIEETEYLKNYNIKIYENADLTNPIFESGEIYTNPYSPNEINYQIPYDLMDGIEYVMQFAYTTNNLYSETISNKFTIIEYGVDKLNADITATADAENGRIKIDIVSKDSSEIFNSNLTIRRTSSESNFHKWEDVKTIAYVNGTALNYTWYDNTIQSGVWYKYCAQKRNSRGNRGVIIQIDEPVMCIFEDIFLTRSDRQLKIKFNPSLSEFKYNVSESQQVTIGNKYPYVTRNGNSYFRSFPIGGLISSFIDTTDWYDPHWNSDSNEEDDNVFPHYDDEDNNFDSNKNEIKLFTSKREIYGENKILYDRYNELNNINEYNDYIYEREFRNKVYDFLYKHDVKLFRSTTQGNILVKLMNIDFQPVETLGRRLYSFTATAIQIDEPTISNCEKYGIQEIGKYEELISNNHDIIGQIQGIYTKQDGNILQTKIENKYKKSQNEGFKNEIQGLKTLKLEIDSDPYVIIEQNNTITKATNQTTFNPSNATIGHIVTINGVNIIVYPKLMRRPFPNSENMEQDGVNGKILRSSDDSIIRDEEEAQIVYLSIYELKDNNTLITSLKFPYPTNATLSYSAELKEVEDRSLIPTRYYYYKKIGQLYGKFSPKDSTFRKIYNKYAFDYSDYYQKLIDITNIEVESCPGAIVYVKDSRDTNLNRHILENGYLQLKNDDITIEGVYFCGIHLVECKDPLEIRTINGMTEDDFELQQGVFENLDQIENPKNGGIYQISTLGLKSGASLQNHQILIVNEDNIQEFSNENFALLLENINDDEKLQFVYFNNHWYFLKDLKDKTKILKHGDIRQVRDNEYILTNQSYESIDDIINPIPNGVYQINDTEVITPISYDEIYGLLIINSDTAYSRADGNYGLILQELGQENNQYIYYHEKWYVFTSNHDVICPVEGIVNYCCQVVKGVYDDT